MAHFHVPKPLHGWREFAGEVGIIVIGVLIALAAEGVADTIHWRNAVSDEKLNLDKDVRSAWDSISARRVIDPCIDRRLADVGRVLDRHVHGKPLGIFAPIGRATVWADQNTALQMASTDGTLEHFSLAERSAYFKVDYQAKQFQRAAWEERDTWRILNGLDHAERLDANGWQRINSAYQDALDSDIVMHTNFVPTYEDGWLSAFNAFPPMPVARSELHEPLAKLLCAPAVKP